MARNYDGNEMEIRVTNRGKFQVLPVSHTPGGMASAPVFDTREEAEAYIVRPMPDWIAVERAKSTAQQPFIQTYAAVLARPDMREMRRGIQELYGYASERSKLASDAQRAAIRATGQVSIIGRDIGAVRQSLADEYGDEVDEAWQAWRVACHKYELALQSAMRDAGIPVTMFRSPELNS